MSKPKPKSTVRISFTVIDESGKETLSRDFFVPFEKSRALDSLLYLMQHRMRPKSFMRLP